MSAYKKLISKDCQICRNGPGRFEVFNTSNTSCGYYCAHHAHREVIRLNLLDEEYRYKEEKSSGINKPTN